MVCGVATVAKDSKVTSITLLAISANFFQFRPGHQYSLSVMEVCWKRGWLIDDGNVTYACKSKRLIKYYSRGEMAIN